MRTDSPLVSIVVPCYNHEKYVQECLQSIIEQTYDNIELLVVDDGSSDNSVFQIEEMLEVCQKRFKRFEFIKQENKGLPATLNASLEWCQGKYYCVIASDDKMLASKTAIQVKFIEKNSEYVAVFSGIEVINDSGEITRVLRPKVNEVTFDDIVRVKHFLPAPTQMIFLDKLKEIGGYNEKFRIEDWYSYLKLTQEGDRVYVLNDVLCQYRRHNQNSSKNLELQREKIEILKYLGLDKNLEDEYLSYVELSLVRELAISDKKMALFSIFKLVKQTPKMITDSELFKVLLKIVIPKLFLGNFK